MDLVMVFGRMKPSPLLPPPLGLLGVPELLTQKYMEVPPPEVLLGAEASPSSRIPRRDGQLQRASSRLACEGHCSLQGGGGADPVNRLWICIVVLGHGFGGGWDNKRHWIIPRLDCRVFVIVGHRSCSVLAFPVTFDTSQIIPSPPLRGQGGPIHHELLDLISTMALQKVFAHG
jgi:hypothetical protein